MTVLIASIFCSQPQTQPAHWITLVSNSTRQIIDPVLGKPIKVTKTGEQSDFGISRHSEFQEISVDFYKGKSVMVTIEFKKAPAHWKSAFTRVNLTTKASSAKKFALGGSKGWADISKIDGLPAIWKARFNPAHDQFSDSGPIPTRAMLSFLDQTQMPRTETN